MTAEEDHDLDYHITFPSPIPGEVEDTAVGTSAIGPQRQEPVVILLGWSGCVDKHLAKYIEIYERSCITIRYSISLSDTFVRTGKVKNSAKKLLELIIDLNLTEHPVLFHVFSNGGCMVYRHMSDFLHGNEQFDRIHIKGCIVDCAPSSGRIITASRAIFEILSGQSLILRCLLTCSIVGIILLVKFIEYLVFFLSFGKYVLPSSTAYFEKFKYDRARCPQLYLYSSKDKVIPYQDVEEHIEYRKSLGIDIQVERWDDCPHVQIFKHHKEVYTNLCRDFLHKCLNK